MNRLEALKAVRRKRDNAEHRLQKAVVQWLHLAGVRDLIFFAVPNGMVSNPVTVSRMKDEGLLPGVGDLCIVLPGGSVAFLELKAPKGAQSPDQLVFEARCRANGTRYAVASTLDEAIETLAGWGALRLDRVRNWRAQSKTQPAEAAA